MKRRLVPFGEYIPFRSLISKITSLTQLQPKDFVPGHQTVVFDVGQIRLGDVICYEVGFDDLVRSDVTGGREPAAMQTNDATFERDGPTRGDRPAARHGADPRGRHDRAVVVASTTGYSAIIAPDGQLITSSGPGSRRARGSRPADGRDDAGRPGGPVAGVGDRRRTALLSLAAVRQQARRTGGGGGRRKLVQDRTPITSSHSSGVASGGGWAPACDGAFPQRPRRGRLRCSAAACQSSTPTAIKLNPTSVAASKSRTRPRIPRDHPGPGTKNANTSDGITVTATNGGKITGVTVNTTAPPVTGSLSADGATGTPARRWAPAVLHGDRQRHRRPGYRSPRLARSPR